jgi:hypothetical protein
MDAPISQVDHPWELLKGPSLVVIVAQSSAEFLQSPPSDLVGRRVIDVIDGQNRHLGLLRFQF